MELFCLAPLRLPQKVIIGVTGSWVLAVCPARPSPEALPTGPAVTAPCGGYCGRCPGEGTTKSPLVSAALEEHCTNWTSCASSLTLNP
ncbi:hypothetical protein ACRRTK_008497 [Alexandromys fortis]